MLKNCTVLESGQKKQCKGKNFFTYVNTLFKVTSANPVIGVTQKFVVTLGLRSLMKAWDSQKPPISARSVPLK